MSTTEIETAAINIMGREFKIKCPKDKTGELHKAVSYLNGKMQDVQRGNIATTIDHVAITAALNISHELLAEKCQAPANTDNNLGELNARLRNLQYKLDKALANQT